MPKPKTLLDDSIPFSVEEAWREGQRNPFAELDSIRDLAAIAVEYPIVLVELGGHVPVDLLTKGYAKATLRRLRDRILMLRLPHLVGHDAVELLDQLAEDYSAKLADPDFCKGEPDPQRTKKVNEGISAAFTEAIVCELFKRSGRLPETFVDACFYVGDVDRPTATNVDFFWAPRNRRIAEMYECKTTPKNFLFKWRQRGIAGHEVDWRRDKLYMLLDVAAKLTAAFWRVHLGCVTIRAREAVVDIAPRPAELHVYCQEDLLGGFPPHICYS